MHALWVLARCGEWVWLQWGRLCGYTQTFENASVCFFLAEQNMVFHSFNMMIQITFLKSNTFEQLPSLCVITENVGKQPVCKWLHSMLLLQCSWKNPYKQLCGICYTFQWKTHKTLVGVIKNNHKTQLFFRFPHWPRHWIVQTKPNVNKL